MQAFEGKTIKETPGKVFMIFENIPDEKYNKITKTFPKEYGGF
jgi:hypothetical protein